MRNLLHLFQGSYWLYPSPGTNYAVISPNTTGKINYDSYEGLCFNKAVPSNTHSWEQYQPAAPFRFRWRWPDFFNHQILHEYHTYTLSPNGHGFLDFRSVLDSVNQATPFRAIYRKSNSEEFASLLLAAYNSHGSPRVYCEPPRSHETTSGVYRMTSSSTR